MNIERRKIEKLLSLVGEISTQPGNEWMLEKFNSNKKSEIPNELSEIYEYCIKRNIKEQAENFYENFKIEKLKKSLIKDFIRMESFRREDNFEDFCLAAFQQLESIVNTLCLNPDLGKYFRDHKNLNPILSYDKESKTYYRNAGNQTIGKFIFRLNNNEEAITQMNKEPLKWYFTSRFRAVLYFHYFNKNIYFNSDKFDSIYDIGDYLYQGRNLNHREGENTKYQQDILDKMLPNKYKYYYKFLGFLEDFVSTVNQNLS